MDPTEKYDKTGSSCCRLRMIHATVCALMVLIFVGINEGQSAVMLPQLRKADSVIHFTADEETWIASLGLMLSPIAALFNGPVLDAFGRKKGLQLFYLITFLGYGVMAFAREAYQLYLGRIICGLGPGLLASAVVYMVEICTKKQREYFIAITSALYASGMTIVSAISGYIHWQVASLIFSTTALLLFVLQSFVPESPAWLFKTGRRDAAIQSLRTFGRDEAEIKQELDVIELQSKDIKEDVNWRTYLEPTVWKPFVIMITFLLLQNASGMIIIFYYSVDFVERLGTTQDPVYATVMVSMTRLVTACTACIFFRSKVGRRYATAFSAFLMTVASVELGAYEYKYQDVSASERPYPWLTVASLMFYVASSALALLGLPWVMCGEVYPLKVRGRMTSISLSIGFSFMFVIVKTYNIFNSALRISSLLFLYAGFSFAAVIFALVILPETHNKSLFEIEQGFLPKNKRFLEAGVLESGNGTR